MNNGRRSCDEARGAEENVKAARLTKRGKNIWQDKKKPNRGELLKRMTR